MRCHGREGIDQGWVAIEFTLRLRNANTHAVGCSPVNPAEELGLALAAEVKLVVSGSMQNKGEVSNASNVTRSIVALAGSQDRKNLRVKVPAFQ